MATKRKKSNYAAREAHRKNVERAKYQQQAEQRKAFFNKYRRHFMIGIPALILLSVAVWLVCKATVGPGGSIPNFFGSLQGVGENWIVSNQGETNAPRYYKMGEFTAPEGYTLDPDYNVSSDSLEQNFYFTANDENALIQSVYVSGVRNRGAAEMVEMVAGYSNYDGSPLISTDPLAGQSGQWILGTVNDAENPEEDAPLEIGHMQLNLYADSVQDACVLVFMNSKSESPADAIPDQEAFKAEAAKILAHLSVER